MVNRQLQIVNIKLGNLRTVKNDLSKENRDLEKQNDKLHKDILKALNAKAKAQSSAATARAGKTAQQTRANGLEGRLTQANTDNGVLNNQLGAATNGQTQYTQLYNDTLAKLGTTATERDGLKSTVKDREADLKVEQAGRAADGNIATANKAKELAEKDKDYGIQIARKDGAIGVQTAEADRDLKVQGAVKDGIISVKTAEADRDLRVLASQKDTEIADQKTVYEVQIAGKDAELKVKIAEADRDRKVEHAEDKVNYLKKFYLTVGAGIAAIAIAATSMYAIGRASAPTIENKVEEKAPKTSAPATTPSTTPATTPSTTPATTPSTTPATTPSTTPTKPATTPSTVVSEPKYLSIEARVEGSWYAVEPGKIASEYRIAVRNKTLDGATEETIKAIQYEAIQGEEGINSLFELVRKIEKRYITQKDYAKIVDKLPAVDVSGDAYTITKADVAKAHELVKKGGLKALLGE